MNRSFEAISESLSMGLPTWICSTQTAHKSDDQIELEEKEKKERARMKFTVESVATLVSNVLDIKVGHSFIQSPLKE